MGGDRNPPRLFRSLGSFPSLPLPDVPPQEPETAAQTRRRHHSSHIQRNTGDRARARTGSPRPPPAPPSPTCRSSPRDSSGHRQDRAPRGILGPTVQWGEQRDCQWLRDRVAWKRECGARGLASRVGPLVYFEGAGGCS
uniref:Uncharacterized protein n=1 Tax=Rhizophora mucronata TaxID=61149 RepID=A0A2P2IIY1_RHIMU